MSPRLRLALATALASLAALAPVASAAGHATPPAAAPAARPAASTAPAGATPAPRPASPAPEAPAPALVGEKPEARSAEQVALRDQGVLLRRNQVTVELAGSYGRSERDFGLTQLEQRQAAAEVALRYGLWDDVQVSARLGGRAQRTRSYAPDLRDERTVLGDLSVGLLGVAVREATSWPNVILSVEGVVPTGPGDAGVGGGLAVTRSHDPVILFAGVAYLHGLRIDAADPDRSLAAHNLAFNVGYAFAVNEAVALNGQLVGSWRSYPATTTPHLSRERYRLQLGVTWLLTRTLFVEPTVAVAVGSASPDVTLGLNVPWSF